MSLSTDNADAITEGDVSSESQNTQPSARELAMERIASFVLDKTADQYDEDLDIDPDNLDGDQLALQNQQAQPAPEPVLTAPVAKVKIDGEERIVTQDELVRSYQKNAAADKRLEEATRLMQEAQRIAEQAAAQPAPVAQPETPPEDLKAKAKSVLSKLYEGDEESASTALADLLMTTRGGDQPTPAPAIDIDQLTLQIQTKMEVDKAFETIQSDYPDLISDPDLEVLTAMKINRAVANGTPRAQAMLTAAQEVYATVGKVATGRQAETPKPVNQMRADNKAKLDLVRPASGVASAKNVEAEENPSSVIAAMQQQRMSPQARRA